jgi:Uma2 family endonuclease
LQGAADEDSVSTSDTVEITAGKIADYFDSGSQMVWVVNPQNKTVLIYHGNTPDKLLKAGDVIDGEAVVPGFKMSIDELFAKP